MGSVLSRQMKTEVGRISVSTLDVIAVSITLEKGEHTPLNLGSTL